MTTNAIEYRDVLNRVDWPRGEWDDEPDKIQWVDAATELDCLMVRNNLGAWCGYVGVPESHPWFGVDYSACTLKPTCEESWCDHQPQSRVRVHGGITFSDFCHEANEANYQRFAKGMASRVQEAAKYPKGDAARAWRDVGHLVGDFEAWQRYSESRSICHRPLDGRPARIFWFGFDTAHSGDTVPGMLAIDRELGFTIRDLSDTYKSRPYVERECAELAAQLATIANGGQPCDAYGEAER